MPALPPPRQARGACAQRRPSSRNPAAAVAETATLSPRVAAVMAPGGIVVSARPPIGLSPLPAPAGIPPGCTLFHRA